MLTLQGDRSFSSGGCSTRDSLFPEETGAKNMLFIKTQLHAKSRERFISQARKSRVSRGNGGQPSPGKNMHNLRRSFH